MSEAKYKNQISIRNDESELLHAEAITTNFKDSKWISYSVSDFFNKEKTQISEIKMFLKEKKEEIKPNFITSPN